MDDEPNSSSPPETPETAQSPVPAPSDTEEPIGKRNRSVKWLIVGGGLVVFLALAAFLGARLLQPQAAGSSGRGQMTFSSNGKSVRLDLIPAKELPQETSATAGLFIRREDQSIFIGTGKISAVAAAGHGGSSVTSSYDGPVVEVVITHDTHIYQDITDMDPGNIDDAKNGSEVKIQQVVKPGSLDDLGPNSIVSV